MGWTVWGSNTGGADIYTHLQNGPRAHTASATIGTGSFPGVKRLELCVDHPPPSSAEVEERVEITSTPRLGPRGLLQGELIIIIIIIIIIRVVISVLGLYNFLHFFRGSCLKCNRHFISRDTAL